MTPRQLKYFIEIARSGSVSRASAQLRIAQPALSQHVAALEKELGVALLERHAKGVRPTAEGQRLLDRAASILAQLDGLKADLAGAPMQPRGAVRLCIASSLGPLLAAPLVRRVEAQHPEVRLMLSTGLSMEVRAQAEARQIDLALMPNVFELPGLAYEPLYQESLHLFGLARLMGPARGAIRFSAIGARPLVAPDRDHDLRRLIERTALETDAPLNVRYEINNAEMALSLVRDGLAFAILPQSVRDGLDRRRIADRPIATPAITRVQAIVRVPGAANAPAIEAVAQALGEVVAELVDAGRLQGRLLAERHKKKAMAGAGK